MSASRWWSDAGRWWCLVLATALGIAIDGHAWFGGHLAHTLPTIGGDVAEQVWFLGWLPHALVHLQNPFITHALFAGSGGVNLMVNTSEFGPALLLSPFTLLGGPILAFNVGVVLAPVVSAWAMFELLRRLVPQRTVAVGVALAWAYSPYVLANLPSGRFHQTVAIAPPLVVLLCLDLVEGRRSPRAVGLLGSALVVIQFFTGSEQLAMVAVAAGVGLVVLLAICPAFVVLHWRRGAEALVVAGAVSSVVLAYPLAVEFFGPRHTTGRPWGWIFEYGDPLATVVSAPRLLGVGAAHAELVGTPGAVTVPLAYLGWGLVLVAIGGTAWLWRRARTRAVAITGLCLAVAQLGVTVQSSPSVTLASWAPWRLVATLPVFEQLIPDRFAQLTAFAVLLLAAWTFAALASLEQRSRTARRTLASVAAVVAFTPWVLAAPVPMPSTTSLPALSWFDQFAATVANHARVLVLPYPDAGLGSSSAPMTIQAMERFRFDLVGGYVLVPTTSSSASAWLVPPTGGEAALQQFMWIFGVSPPSSAERAAVARVLRERRVDDVVLLPIIGDNALAEAKLVATMGRSPGIYGGILLWRHAAQDVHPLAIANAAIVRCAAVGGRPQTIARCVLAAGSPPR